MNPLAKINDRLSGAPKQIKRAFELIAPQLSAVEDRIREQARAFDPAVEDYVAYACESNGKRLRPALVLLAGGATGPLSSSHVDLAVVLELIHAGTLVHDDIMDGADLRRGQPTANAKWGNAISVLLGDCLLAHALKLSTTFSNADVSRRIADAATQVCSGEIIQTQRRFDLKLTLADYYRIIEMKTAALFEAATELGALLSEAPESTVAAMKTFGLKLGIAYQIYDDCLDIAGNESKAGKTLGSDVRKGKLTLPVLHLLHSVSAEELPVLSEAIVRGNDDDCALIKNWAHERGGVAAAITATRDLLHEARTAVAGLDSNPFRDGLCDVCESLGTMLDQFA